MCCLRWFKFIDTWSSLYHVPENENSTYCFRSGMLPLRQVAGGYLQSFFGIHFQVWKQSALRQYFQVDAKNAYRRAHTRHTHTHLRTHTFTHTHITHITHTHTHITHTLHTYYTHTSHTHTQYTHITHTLQTQTHYTQTHYTHTHMHTYTT